MYNIDFLPQIEAHRRHLYGHSDPDEALDNAERMAALPREIKTVKCYQDTNGEWTPRKRPEPEQVKWGRKTLLVIPRDGGRHVLGEMYSGAGRLETGEKFEYQYAVPLLKKDQKGCRRFLSVFDTRGVESVTFEELHVPYVHRGSSVEGVVASEDGGMRIATDRDEARLRSLRMKGF